MQLFIFLRQGLLCFRKRNKPQKCPHNKNAMSFVSLPEAQKVPPKECKQLHTCVVESAQDLEPFVWHTLWTKKLGKILWIFVASRAKSQVTDFVVALCPATVIAGQMFCCLWLSVFPCFLVCSCWCPQSHMTFRCALFRKFILHMVN